MGSYGWIQGLIQGGINAGLTSDTLKGMFKSQRDQAQAVEKADKSLMTSAMQTISRINVERAGIHRATSNALFAIQSQKQQYQGSVAAGAAATGSIGASVQAAMADADVQASKAVSTVMYNQDVQDNRLFEQSNDLRLRTSESFRAHTLAPVMSRWDSQWTVFKAFASGFMGSGGASVSDTLQYNQQGTDVANNPAFKNSDGKAGYNFGADGDTSNVPSTGSGSSNPWGSYGQGGMLDGYRGSDMSSGGSSW